MNLRRFTASASNVSNQQDSTPQYGTRPLHCGFALVQFGSHAACSRSTCCRSWLTRMRTNQRRTMLGVPLVRNGRAVGVITLLRTEVRAFAVRQIALVEAFAAQALIAIENARLFEAEQTRTKELTEARNVEPNSA
jgi:transcriptional regulator with GAF, ATPase, and Fis domain